MLHRIRRSSLALPALLCALALAALMVIGCAGFGGPPTVTLRPGDIQALMQKHFPLERRLLEVLVDTRFPAHAFANVVGRGKRQDTGAKKRCIE